MNFSSKTTCALGCGTGLGTGGTVAHQNSIPYTWRELLVKEGTTFLYRDHDYKGIFYDQKSSLENDSITLSSDDVSKGYEKVMEWCKNKLNNGYENESDLSKEREKIFKYCTIKGITTLKGKLGQINQTGWIADSTESDKDSLYKAIFAIYRYEGRFLSWLNEDKTANKISETDKPSQKHGELKTKCETALKKNISEVSNTEEYGYVVWWCQPLPYKTVKEKLEKDVEGWQQRSDWKSAAAIWNEVPSVKTKVKGSNTNDPKENDYKTWCESALKKELKDDNVFKDDYQYAYSICRP